MFGWNTFSFAVPIEAPIADASLGAVAGIDWIGDYVRCVDVFAGLWTSVPLAFVEILVDWTFAFFLRHAFVVAVPVHSRETLTATFAPSDFSIVFASSNASLVPGWFGTFFVDCVGVWAAVSSCVLYALSISVPTEVWSLASADRFVGHVVVSVWTWLIFATALLLEAPPLVRVHFVLFRAS